MSMLGKRRYDFYPENYYETDEDYRAFYHPEHNPSMDYYSGMDFHSRPDFHSNPDFHPRGSRKKKNKRKNKNKKPVEDRPKRQKLSDPKDDEYIIGRIIGNMNKPSNTKAFENSLMIADWLKEIPEDFEDTWTMVPCPLGKRMLVVAGSECTRSYTKNGEPLFYFTTSLPGGHIVADDEPSRKITILDCIWHHKHGTYYVLDGMMWNSTHLLDCQAEFRFFWLEQKLLELKSVSTQSSDNDYPFVFLPRFSCKKAELTTRMKNCQFPKKILESIDGFLFFKKNASYFNGVSSDVGWLKPFMIPEVLKMSVGPQLLMNCPGDCPSMDEYIKEFDEDKRGVLIKERKHRRCRYLEKLSEGRVKEEMHQMESSEIQEVGVKEEKIIVIKIDDIKKEKKL